MRLTRALTVAVLAALAAACGGQDAAPTPQPKFDGVTGSVSKGPLQGATVDFYLVDAAGNLTGSTLATVSTDDAGQFAVTGLPAGVPILVQARGGSYLDESDPQTDPALRRRISFGPTDRLEAVLPPDATTLAITPYSMALLKKARIQAAGSNFANVYAAVQEQAQAAFGFDPILTQPADPITGAGGSQAYAMLLGAAALTINQIAVTGTPEHLPGYSDVIAFVNDFADGRLTAANLDQMIRRFRNNNIGVYAAASTPTVDEAVLSEPAVVANTPPTISSIANQTISEGANTGALSFTVGDAETAVGSLTLSGSSNNTALVPNTSIAFGGSAASRTVTVTPAGNGSGTATITVTVTDTEGGSAATAFVLTVTGVNDAPVANNDSISLAEGGSATTLIGGAPSVLSNDTDADGNPVTAVLVSGPPNAATFLLNANGTFSYLHDNSETTSDSFTYKANDGTVDSNVATVTISISPVNDPPVAVDDVGATNEDVAFSVAESALLANDTDPDGPALAIVNLGGTSNGSVTAAGGVIMFLPTPNFNGTGSFQYEVSDGTASDFGVVTVTINAVNDAPSFTVPAAAPSVKENDPAQTVPGFATGISVGPANEGAQAVSFTVTNNDNTALFAAGPAIGADGTLTYTPAAGQAGTASITIVAIDNGGTANGGVDTSAPRSFSITVVAGGTKFFPFRDASGSLKVIDPRVGLASITQVATGVPEHNDTNPNNYQTLFAADIAGVTGQATNIRHARTAFIKAGQVFVVNLDTGAAPTLVATSITDACGFFDTGEDIAAPDNSALFIKTSGVDATCGNADDLPKVLLGLSPSAMVVDAPNLQRVRGLHSSAGALIGHLALFGTSQSDGTAVKRCDTSFNCATTVATLAAGGGNFNFMREKGFSLFYLAFRDTDDPGTRLYRYDVGGGVLSAPLHDFTGSTHDGTPDGSDFYFPNGNALYRVGHSNTTSQLLVTMAAGDQIEDMELTANRAVFEARNASGITNVYSVAKGGGPSTALFVRALLANESARLAHVDAGGRVFLDASVDSGGTRTAESSAQVLDDGSGFAELADSTYAGGTRVTSFNLEAMDDLPALRLLRVRHTPTGPNSSDDTLETIDPVTGAVVNSPGVLSAVIRFDGVNGDGVGRYVAIEATSAGDGLHDVHLIDTQAIGITNVSSGAGEENWVFFESDGPQPPGNGAPSAANDGYVATEDTPLTISAPGILGNDSDPESNPLTAVLDFPPLAVQGSIALNTNGSFTFTPAPDFNGPASFTYHANDGQANSNIATVTINVAAVNDAPVANGDAYTVSVNTPLNVAAPGVLSNDADPDGTTPTANAASGSTAQLGTFMLNTSGSFTYTPPSSTFTGPDSFTYTATDGALNSNVATVNITVTANTPPTISNIADQAINEDTSTGALAFTVGDAETPAASLTVSGTSSNLTLVPSGNIAFGGSGTNRTVTVTPAANQFGTATITVTVTDSASGTASDPFLLTVNAVADTPVANNDAYSTPVNTTLTIAMPGVLSNDTDPDGPTPTASAASGTGTAGGSFTLNTDGSFTYTPLISFAGTDSFTYMATDGGLSSGPATVTINVTAGPAFSYLPYFVDTAQKGGEFVVKSTDFTPPPITVVPTGSATPTSIDRVTSTNVVLNADSSINTIFQDRLVFIESGQLWYSGLRDSDAPTAPTRFSSETAATASCGVNLEEMNFSSSRDAWFFYRLPGVDANCFTPDDVTKAAKLSFGTAGGPGSDPITLPPGSNEFPMRFFAPTDLRTLGFLVMDAGKLDFYDANLLPVGNFLAGGVTSVSRLRGDFNKALVVVNNTDGRIVSVSDATTPVPAITAVVYTVQSGFSNNCGANEDATHYYVCENRFSPPAARITSIPKSATDTSGNVIVHDNTINTLFLQGLTDNRVVWQSGNELLMLNKSGPPNQQTLTTSIAPGPVLLGATRIFFTESAGANVYAAMGKDEANAQIFSGGTASAWVGLGAQIVGQTTSGFVTDRAVRGLLVQGFGNFDTTGVFGSTLKSVDLTAPAVSVPAASITTFANSTTDNRDLFIFVNAPTFTGLGALCEKSPGTDCDIVAIDASAAPRYQRVTVTPATSENPTSE